MKQDKFFRISFCVKDLYRGSQGYRTDDDTSAFGFINGDCGLTKVGARYYDVGTGSFISRDTDIGQAPFAYCAGDPVNNVDPSGHNTVADAVNATLVVLFGITGLAIAAITAPFWVAVGLVIAILAVGIIGAYFVILILKGGKHPKEVAVKIPLSRFPRNVQDQIRDRLKGIGPPSLSYPGYPTGGGDGGGTTTVSPGQPPPMKG